MKVKRKKREHPTASDRRRRLLMAAWLLGLVAIAALVAHRVTRATAPSAPVNVQALWRVHVPASMPDTLLRYEGFTVHFNPALHVPNCASYALTRRHALAEREAACDFAADPAVPGCALPKHYAKSGFQRGHMAPAADFKWSERALASTYLMTNIAPQRATLNEGAWQRLETKVREWAVRDSVVVVHTGPIFGAKPNAITATGVAIPTHYFKVIYFPCAQPAQVAAYIVPNGATGHSLEPYRTTLAEVQRRTRLRFPAMNP